MKRSATILGLIALVVVVAFIWRQLNPGERDGSKEKQGEQKRAMTDAVASAATGQSPALLGETILRDYGNPSLPPENDLTLLSRLMENSLLLVKASKDRPLSANADWAAALRGINPAQERFLSDRHRAFNAQGELVDRWDSVLFFHALGGGRYEVRSAGPDRQLWTADDLHRNYDGSFRRGQDLNSTSLLETATPRRP